MTQMNFMKNSGFSLVEVLVSLVILSTGLLTMATFHSSVISDSNDNKNRGEAIVLAQERLEQMRNFSDLAPDEEAFEQQFPASTEFANATRHSGVNALFIRQEKITDNDNTKFISVQVSWKTTADVSEYVTLETELTWHSTSLSGNLDTSAATGPMVRSATGRATLGKGKITDEELLKNVVYGNGDTTGLLDKGDGDLLLLSGSDVVLTLEDACEIDNNNERTHVPCTGFVEISGTVYIDRHSSSMDIGQVHVIASDAAYCQSYYVVDNQPFEINAATTRALTTANNDYEYFQYTCYLGGGWHGNIGILVDGPISACMGDPTASHASLTPNVAIRRVYRGMAFGYESDGTTKVADNNGDTIYYSVGVADALKLPEEGQAGHDFVIASLTSTDGAECVTDAKKLAAPMFHTDANLYGTDGDLFTGVPTDFVCLNQDDTWVDNTKLQAFGYAIDNYCPFNPSDPPSAQHSINGSIHIDADSSLLTQISAIEAYTSDGFYNCETFAPELVGSKYQISYQCQVYDWGEGWTGYIQITPDLSVINCSNYQLFYSGANPITADQGLATFNCAAKDGVIPDPDPDPAPDPDPGPDPVLGTVTITGNIIQSGAGRFDYVSMTGGSCTVSGSTYTCSSLEFDLATYWSGTLSYSASKKVACLGSPSDNLGGTIAVTEGSSKATLELISVSSGNINVDATFAKSCN
ncbi:type IV pilus modification PilV family protein [Thalassotalea sp. ND16A]|uniref:type IV pilus modification PilV family protein n=1 Tax=Thalassotalea sp. ND16A TaxID=1535422 RepID=UPI00051A57F9|nr:prepilin-type N-terminal cleavage/methylation domain-containing protein [Thalassotalea sp. ND16A]KGJ88253.1 hypothetical protein ND16A_0193 [Thalassotalea sp. ND16A]